MAPRALGLAIFVLTMSTVTGFKDQDFKKCKDSAFIQRLRGKTDFSYAVQPGSVQVTAAELTATVTDEQSSATFALRLTAYEGMFRLHVDEIDNPRYQLADVLLPGLQQAGLEKVASSSAETTLALDGQTVTLTYRPFSLEVPGVLTLNERNMFTMEHRRAKQDGDPAGYWEESFKSHKDSKPKGPQAISFDVAFPGYHHVYGLPEHAMSLSLKPTVGEGIESDPYRLYNLDVFEYLTDSPFGLYGSIPLLLAHRRERTVGVFWLNAAEMFVDVEKGPAGVATQWVAESGVLDLFVLLGPHPAAVQAQYARLTGTTAMPQMFSLGYHQCRWNYKDEADVAAVNAGFDEHAMPCDVIWLDIEHTDGKRYMTWDAAHFPDPVKMQDDVASAGRKMVTIVDPHVKRDPAYAMHAEAERKRYYVRDATGKDFEGWCWPGASSYLDMLDPAIRSWWADQFALDKYAHSTANLYIWNDMNEPSVFNGPEITMHKDALHAGGTVEHRDVHNVYGLWYHAASAEGLRRRGYAAEPIHGDRTFVLSRAFFAGTQRVGPVWTGDNAARWEHLKVSVPMLLTLNIAGLPNAGADVGGFFANPEPELLLRWYQAAAFYPFFRGHAHLETQRREPWLFGEPMTTHIRAAMRERYALLPYLYTLFRAANATGEPIMQPLWYTFPDQAALYAVEEQFMLGPAMLVAPVLAQGAAGVEVPFPEGDRFYDAATGDAVAPAASGATFVPVTEASIPRFYRGGHIVPRRERARRSTKAQRLDPYTLVVALDAEGSAEGRLYIDDGKSYAFQAGQYLEARIEYSGGQLRYRPEHVGFKPATHFERIVVLGAAAERGERTGRWEEAGVRVDVGAGAVTVDGDGQNALVIRNPRTPVAEAWTIQLGDA